MAILVCLSGCTGAQPPLSTDLKMSDSSAERQLIGGFYQPEQNWRWVARRFAVVFPPPSGSEQSGATLQLRFFISKTTIGRLGPMTLTAIVGNTSLAPETFTRFGNFTYHAEVPPTALQSNRVVPVVFTFDKALSPGETDGRELSVVVTEVSLRASPIGGRRSLGAAPS